MGKFSFGELLIVLAIVLIVFGPKKLPELARGMGEAVKEFKKGQADLEQSFKEPAVSESQKSEAPTVEKTQENK